MERHLARQRNGEVLSAQEEQREREVVEWFGRCGAELRAAGWYWAGNSGAAPCG